MEPLRSRPATIVSASSKRPTRCIEGIAEGAELQLAPPGSEPQDQPAIADLVDRIRHLGQQRRVTKGRAGDEQPDRDPVRGGGQRGHE
jgi:hypothetical protein